MKCPNCGAWNRNGYPHCFKCGTPLEAAQSGAASDWSESLKTKRQTFISVDEHGNSQEAYDPRDVLASQMVDLARRKQDGRRQKRQISERIPSISGYENEPLITTANNRDDFYADVRQNPVKASVEAEPLPESSFGNIPQLTPPRFEDSRNYAITINGVQENTDQYGSTAHTFHNQPLQEILQQEDAFYETWRYNRKNSKQRYLVRRMLPWLISVLVIIAIAIIAIYVVIPKFKDSSKSESTATVMSTIRNDLAAHTVYIPGEEGARITIRELRSSSIVVNGVATFDIPDYIWYNDSDTYLQDTMPVKLSPFITMENGQQKALPAIHYDIDIPLSPIELDVPDSLYKEVSTALYNIAFYVREGSTVTINGSDYSDLVNTGGGKVSYNATVQPIGENKFEIEVHSQYCRKNTMTITLYRAKQDIPLDLASDVATSTSSASGSITIHGTTLPGAVIKVLTPYTDLDITNTPIDGTFSFVTKFDKIGNNNITITADYPGKKTTTVEHVVYWVPNIDVYSRKAWDLVEQYTDLMDNIELRKSRSQIYVGKGVITSIDTTKPQRAFMNIGTAESPIYVYIENSSKTTWVEGKTYRVYGDAYGMYDSKPWLIVRYTYSD